LAERAAALSAGDWIARDTAETTAMASATAEASFRMRLTRSALPARYLRHSMRTYNKQREHELFRAVANRHIADVFQHAADALRPSS